MAFNEQRNKNKAKVWTVIVHILLMLWFAFYGLTYQDPPPEEGIAINFGYEETGAGQNTQAAPTIPPPTPATPVETPPVQEEVVTQDVEDAPVIESTDDPTPTKPKEVAEQPKETTEKPTETVQEPEPDPQPTEEELERQRKEERLNRMFNTNRSGSGQGEGETTGGGDQGDPNGDPLSPNRTAEQDEMVNTGCQERLSTYLNQRLAVITKVQLLLKLLLPNLEAFTKPNSRQTIKYPILYLNLILAQIPVL